jgi:hypothetical protein
MCSNEEGGSSLCFFTVVIVCVRKLRIYDECLQEKKIMMSSKCNEKNTYHPPKFFDSRFFNVKAKIYALKVSHLGINCVEENHFLLLA